MKGGEGRWMRRPKRKARARPYMSSYDLLGAQNFLDRQCVLGEVSSKEEKHDLDFRRKDLTLVQKTNWETL